ncbi:MAG: RNA-binding transcriptional accessory protein [Lachnospiraceae bacterium]|nr:RNA-binding transcriptional accessory protein [Lachnospiraceae bacterium]
MNIGKVIAGELNIKEWQVEKAIELIDEGNTIPFISRYRKEVTGSLNDEQLRSLDERLTYLRNLEEKKVSILATIEEQGKLTDELKKQIEDAMTMVVLEDLYRPYRPKRRTRATVAKEKGLEGLANIIALQMTKKTIEEEAKAYISEEKEVNTVEDAIAGAKDILAENYADEAEYRKVIRDLTREKGRIITSAKDKEAKSVYEMYYEFEDDIKKLTGYRVLAINRGEAEKFLTVKIEAPVDEIIKYLNKTIIYRPEHESTKYIEEAIADSYDRLIAPSIEREIRNELTETAEEGAINVFGKNLHQLLMQPPVAGHTVLGWDPGYNHGSKLAVVDATGKVLDTVIIYPTMGKKRELEAREILKKLIAKYKVTLISLGNGTASRESEALIVDLLKEIGKDIKYVIVNEAGASIYSASKAATEELPDFDEWQRSAASIARRIQDPLAELVKIDPKSIGVGQYQHDMNQKNLDNALTAVVEDCVNNVGVDLNTASPQLLSYISGISKPIAKNIVSYRENNGRFTNRKDLLKVPKLGHKAYEQCAGFMRILDGDEVLDSTSVHPESYEATKLLMKKLNVSEDDLKSGGIKGNAIKSMVKDTKKTAEEIGLGEPTLIDILKELEKPGRDPREELEKPILRSDVLEMKDLTQGMQLKGTVRNVIDFGAFVDIGVHQDGLVHISKMSKKYIKHPLEVVSVGDIIDVTVIGVDLEKKRIQLSMVD